MRRISILVTAVAVVALLGGGACTKKEEQQPDPKTEMTKKTRVQQESGRGVHVETDEGTYTVKGDQGGGNVNINTKDGKKIKLSY